MSEYELIHPPHQAHLVKAVICADVSTMLVSLKDYINYCDNGSFIAMVAFSKFITSQRGGQILVDTDGYLSVNRNTVYNLKYLNLKI